MSPVNSGGHTAYQTFVLENLRKYYPDPTVFAKSTWDIIERFWNLDLSYTAPQQILCLWSKTKDSFLYATFSSSFH